jgi:hypothetical protein
MQRGVTPSITSDATFSSATVDINRATSCGVTQSISHATELDATKRATS